MKTRKNMLLLACIGMVAVQTACTNYDADDHKFGNVVYLDVAETSEVQAATIKNTLDVFDRTFAATLAYPSDQDVTLSVAVDPSLVERYNTRYGTAWPMLDAKYYTLSAETATIPAGRTTSDVVTLQLKELMGEGDEQTGALPLDETYLVPVTISQSSVPVKVTSPALTAPLMTMSPRMSATFWEAMARVETTVYPSMV